MVQLGSPVREPEASLGQFSEAVSEEMVRARNETEQRLAGEDVPQAGLWRGPPAAAAGAAAAGAPRKKPKAEKDAPAKERAKERAKPPSALPGSPGRGGGGPWWASVDGFAPPEGNASKYGFDFEKRGADGRLWRVVVGDKKRDVDLRIVAVRAFLKGCASLTYDMQKRTLGLRC